MEEKIKITCVIVFVGVVLFMLIGCSFFKKEKVHPVIKTDTVEVQVPVFTCPKELTNIQHPTRPTLMIELLTEDDKDDPGRVAQYYKATIKQLLNYSQELEADVHLYDHACATPPQ